MNVLAPIKEVATLPSLVRSAANRLAKAETAAEVLEAREAAGMAYDAAKRAARIAKAKNAHDEIMSAVMHAQADALDIESAAKRRLADEYDAAQERGEAASQGRPKKRSEQEPFFTPGSGREAAERFAENLLGDDAPIKMSEFPGVTKKDIFDARQLRDAERDDPGVTRRTLDRLVEAGQTPTRAAVKREILARPEPRVKDDSLWLWGRLRDFDQKGILNADPASLLLGMTHEMRADVMRLVPLVREFLEDMEVRFEPA